MYRLVDAAFVRTVALPLPSDIAWPDITGDADCQHWGGWLRRVWASEEIAAAIELASPSLARRVAKVCDGEHLSLAQLRRTVLSVVRYLLRAKNRVTPFGLFAGVAPARFGNELRIRFGDEHRARARVDAEWLAGVIEYLERCVTLRCRLSLVTNNLAFIRDGRLVVSCQRRAGALGHLGPAEVSVRHTRAVGLAMQAAQSPILGVDLISLLKAQLSAATTDLIDGMLDMLVSNGFLITSLRPPMTVTAPLSHLVGELLLTSAREIPQIADLVQQLRDIHDDVDRHDQEFSPAEARRLRSDLIAAMNQAWPCERPLTVDLRADCDMVLPDVVAREAERAATVLTRLAAHPTGAAAWRDFHARFLDRYGIGAVVPVSQVVNSDIGLGFPTGYRDAQLHPPPGNGLTERDQELLAMAQAAAADHSLEMVLDDAFVTRLPVEEILTVQPHTELRFRLHASTKHAVAQGDFRLAVVGVSRAAGTTTGRFLDLLDSPDHMRTINACTRLSTLTEDALPVLVSCPTLYTRAENIARTPGVLPDIISLAEHRTLGIESMQLDDLAVTCDASGLRLISLSKGHTVEPMVFNSVDFVRTAHPLVRFLCEITTARAAACAPFSWGVAERLPFLPRLRYGRTILTPARWVITAADLPDGGKSLSDWTEHLTAWRHRFSVPAVVYLGESDRRLRLDLDEPTHRHLLRTDVERNGHASLREAPHDNDLGWCDGRAHEIVVPLTSNRTPRPSRRIRTGTIRPISTEHGQLPGSGDWLYLKLYTHPDRQTTILTTHLPELLAAWDNTPEWWFIRFEDPDPHLRIRIRVPGRDAFGGTVGRVGEWVAQLRRRGLTARAQLDTYYPEIGRFGDGAAMAATHSVFAADSAAAIAQLTVTRRNPDLDLHALTAASLVNLATSLTGSIEHGMGWLVEHTDRTTSQAPTRKTHDNAMKLADPHDDWAAIRSLSGGGQLLCAWARRRSTLTTYRHCLSSSGVSEADLVLPDLIHLHVVRTVGLVPDVERLCLRLARSAALSWTTRTRGTP